jgi:NADH:ubiquinone reductase (H+-translocating)
MSSETDAPRSCDVVILGSSFAGIEVAYQLVRQSHGNPPKIVVIDRQEEHGYLPLVQERLCGRLDPERFRLRSRAFVESIRDAAFVRDEIEAFDPTTRTVRLHQHGAVEGRIVVVALGSVVEPPRLRASGALVDDPSEDTEPSTELLVPYKSGAQLEDAATRLDRVLRGASESPEVVVVGGGISGVELAGELADLRRDRPEGWVAPRVTLISSGEHLLEGFGPRIAATIERALREQGVDLRLGARVAGVRPGVVEVRTHGNQSSEIPADLAFWAGGIRPAPILAALGLPRTDAGWLAVGPTLQCFATPRPTQPSIFACGDAVRIQGGTGQWRTMPRAIEAIWQAKVVAANVLTLLAERDGFPDGVPPLRPHRLRETFFYGLSVGARSYVAWLGRLLGIPGVNHRFRRWLMAKYFERYTPLPGHG